jgi:RNA polymerase sigma-70 factor (ECF subfamily)
MLSVAMPIDSVPAPVSALPADETADWVRSAAAGNAAAFERLYRAHVKRVHAVIWRLVGGVQARAEELTQEAFVRAWQALPGFRGDSAFATWLHRLAVNVALMDLRARRAGEDLETDDSQIEFIHGHAASRQRADLGMDLERAVATLPPRARAVLVLHDVEGWKHDEIAAQLGMAVGTSKAQLHRARGLLRKLLGDET